MYRASASVVASIRLEAQHLAGQPVKAAERESVRRDAAEAVVLRPSPTCGASGSDASLAYTCRRASPESRFGATLARRRLRPTDPARGTRPHRGERFVSRARLARERDG